MNKIYSISHLRNNLSEIVSEVENSNEEVLILRDSSPAVVLVPYSKFEELRQKDESQPKKQTQSFLKHAGKFASYAKSKNFNVENHRDLSYEER